MTRSLLKRQVRAAADRLAGLPAAAQAGAAPSPELLPSAAHGLAAGLWIVRLRSPFERQAFPSAASEALRSAVRSELDLLLAAAVLRCAGAVAAATRRRSGKVAAGAASERQVAAGAAGGQGRCATGRDAA